MGISCSPPVERATRPFRPATGRTDVISFLYRRREVCRELSRHMVGLGDRLSPSTAKLAVPPGPKEVGGRELKSKIIQAPSGAASSDPATRLLCHSTFASIKKKRGCRPYGARKKHGLRWLHRCRASGAPRAAVEVEFTVRSATVSVVAPGYSGTGDSSVPSGHWPDGCSLFPLPPPGNLP